MSFGPSVRNGISIGLLTAATLLGRVVAAIPVVGNLLAAETLVALETEDGQGLLVEPVI